MSVESQQIAAQVQRRIDTIKRRAQRQIEQAEYHAARRQRVLQLLCAGKCQKGTALALGIDRRDVSYALRQLMRKAGCKTSMQLAVWAVRQGLV